jgi:hypothetical protein
VGFYQGDARPVVCPLFVELESTSETEEMLRAMSEARV